MKPDTRKAEKGKAKLAGAFKGAHVKRSLAKTAVIIFRATPAEKKDMQATAQGLGMSLTEYLGRLHALAKENMR